MTDRRPFEVQLTEAFSAYVVDAPVQVDPHGVAAAAATAATTRARRWRPASDRTRALLPIAAAFVALSVIGTAAFVGADRAPGPTVASPTPSPSSSQLSSPAPSVGAVTPLADMAIGRRAPVALTLANGRVLVAGGMDQTPGQVRVPVEVLDPDTGRFSPVAGDGPTGDGGGSAVLLPGGRALIIMRNLNETSSRAFVFDPATMAVRRLASDRPSNAPVFGVNPSLALLNDGRVLIAGGQADVYKADLLASAQIFDPSTETFTATGSMAVARYRHSMTTLADGRVLIAGGEGAIDFDGARGAPVPPDHLASAEIYDPADAMFTPIGSMSKARGPMLAVTRPDGRVVLTPEWGPFSELRILLDGSAPYRKDAPVPVEIFDAESDAFLSAGQTPRAASSATLLPDGRLLLTGLIGEPASGDVVPGTWAAIHDPVVGSTQSAAAPRAWFAAPAALGDGRVLFFGGMSPLSDGWPGDSVPWVDLYR